MDFCAFGRMKTALSKRKPTTIDGIWKVIEGEWISKPLEVSRIFLLSQKSQSRLRVHNYQSK